MQEFSETAYFRRCILRAYCE